MADEKSGGAVAEIVEEEEDFNENKHKWEDLATKNTPAGISPSRPVKPKPQAKVVSPVEDIVKDEDISLAGTNEPDVVKDDSDISEGSEMSEYELSNGDVVTVGEVTSVTTDVADPNSKEGQELAKEIPASVLAPAISEEMEEEARTEEAGKKDDEVAKEEEEDEVAKVEEEEEEETTNDEAPATDENADTEETDRKVSFLGISKTNVKEESKKNASQTEVVNYDVFKEAQVVDPKDIPKNASPLPDRTQLKQSGYTLGKVSSRMFSKKWKEIFWLRFGDTTMLIFDSKDDCEEWLTDPLLTKRQRNNLIRREYVFYDKKAMINGVRGYRLSLLKGKTHKQTEKLMYHYKLEKWTDNGVRNVGAFASEQMSEIIGLRATINECLVLCPSAGLRQMQNRMLQAQMNKQRY